MIQLPNGWSGSYKRWRFICKKQVCYSIHLSPQHKWKQSYEEYGFKCLLLKIKTKVSSGQLLVHEHQQLFWSSYIPRWKNDSWKQVRCSCSTHYSNGDQTWAFSATIIWICWLNSMMYIKSHKLNNDEWLLENVPRMYFSS